MFCSLLQSNPAKLLLDDRTILLVIITSLAYSHRMRIIIRTRDFYLLLPIRELRRNSYVILSVFQCRNLNDKLRRVILGDNSRLDRFATADGDAPLFLTRRGEKNGDVSVDLTRRARTAKNPG